MFPLTTYNYNINLGNNMHVSMFPLTTYNYNINLPPGQAVLSIKTCHKIKHGRLSIRLGTEFSTAFVQCGLSTVTL